MIMILVAILVCCTVGGLGFVLVGADSSHHKAMKRVQLIGARTKTEKTARANQDTVVNRRKQILQNLKAVEKQQRKTSLTLEMRIQQAGLSTSVRTFWIFCGILAGGVFLPALVVTRAPLIALGLAFGAGLGLPRWFLGFRAKGRVKKFTEEFPNATDVIVRGIKSGLPVNDCLKVIARESPQPLGAEFGRFVENVGVGLSMDESLDKLYGRMPTSEVRFFSIVLAIQQKTGGNLAEALGNLSTVLRARRLMREKIKALSGEAIASAVIIGVLPPGIMLLVTFTSPHYMTPLYFDPRGHVMLMGGAFWMAIGIFLMRRMINFKF